MSRYKRIYYSKAVYHVIFRGNNRQCILKELPNKEKLLKIIERYRQRYDFTVYAFVLMDNHVHLVLRTHATSGAVGVINSAEW